MCRDNSIRLQDEEAFFAHVETFGVCACVRACVCAVDELCVIRGRSTPPTGEATRSTTPEFALNTKKDLIIAQQHVNFLDAPSVADALGREAVVPVPTPGGALRLGVRRAGHAALRHVQSARERTPADLGHVCSGCVRLRYYRSVTREAHRRKLWLRLRDEWIFFSHCTGCIVDNNKFIRSSRTMILQWKEI